MHRKHNKAYVSGCSGTYRRLAARAHDARRTRLSAFQPLKSPMSDAAAAAGAHSR